MFVYQEAGPKLPSQVERERFESRQTQVAHASHDDSVAQIRKRVLQVRGWRYLSVCHSSLQVHVFRDTIPLVLSYCIAATVEEATKGGIEEQATHTRGPALMLRRHVSFQ